MKSIFECRLAKMVGTVSFGIYALHWPTINSIGLRIIVILTNKMQADMMMILSLLSCFLITVVLAIIFKVTVEKLTEGLCIRIHRD